MNEFRYEPVSDKEKEPNLSQEIADKLRALGEDWGFDQETCDEIAQLPFGEAFEMAYSYLVQAGFDPDEILADFMEPTN